MGTGLETFDLNHKLRSARQASGLSQQEVAQSIGVPRTAITQIEAGNRSVSSLELSKLAALFLCSVSDLLPENPSHNDQDVLLVLHRAAPTLKHDPSAREEVARCVNLCRDGLLLKHLLGTEPRLAAPNYEFPTPRSSGQAVSQGEDAATQERRRLGIGNAPIVEISELIASQGIWAASLALPSDMSGMFVRHSSIGCVVLVNSSHARGRKRFSYAHEYAHALFDRDRNVAVSETVNSEEMIEKRANAFAAAFLMPRNGMYEALRNLDKGMPLRQELTVFNVANNDRTNASLRPPPGSQQINFKDVAMLAHHFGVGYRAALLRLQSLGFVSHKESPKLLRQQGFGRQVLQVLGMSPDMEDAEEPKYWDRELRSEIANLAIEAHRREEISRGRVLELSSALRIPGDELLRLSEVARTG